MKNVLLAQPAQRRTETAIRLSERIVEVATYVICRTLVDYQDLLSDERMSVAHAFLQRVTTTHLCNQKLTKEGIVFQYKGEPFELHEEYKTMTLTRSVYEHLAMFYFLFEHPKSVEEREIVWKYWQINSKKNLLEDGEIEALRKDILTTKLGKACHKKLDEWTRVGTHPVIGSIEFVGNGDKHDVKRLNYSQAWKYLFDDEEMESFYRHLSMHCHPVYDGLLQYQDQGLSDQGYDGIPLYLSSCFLAHLCRLFLKMIPDGDKLLKSEFGNEIFRDFQL